MQIFLDETDYGWFVHLLGDVVEQFNLECWNYCVMPNHYHLTLRTDEPTLSKAVHDLNGNYAQWWNKRHERVGHVFQGRFKEQIVQEQDYLVVLCRYVARNPVRGGLAMHPEEWKWSSYGMTVGIAAPLPFVASASVLRLFGDESSEVLQERFARYVSGTAVEDVTDARIRSTEKIIGDGAFKRSVSLRLKDSN
jgi:REP-associated tyrosine transposase